jgi:hypothetical protein
VFGAILALLLVGFALIFGGVFWVTNRKSYRGKIKKCLSWGMLIIGLVLMIVAAGIFVNSDIFILG